MTGAGKITAQMGRKVLMSLPAVALVAGTGALLPLGAAVASASPIHARHALTVATRGTDHGNCRRSPCKTLGYALTQAGPHDTIVIGPGTYRETGNANVVTPGLKGLSIRSTRSAARTVIDAAGNANGILIQASGVSVTGLTVKNASLEGILAEPPLSSWPAGPTSAPANISHVTIAGNVVVHNDRAYDTSLPPDSACPSSHTDADDCGEGIHLLGVSWSKVVGNNVSHNVGGILLSDGGFGISVGPAAHNLIAFNRSADNRFDCGITLPGHDARAVATSGPNAGKPRPSLAGVYDNRVVHNVSTGNGGAGLLDATPYPGTGSYDNLFADNSARGNGNAGFVLHSHAPLQDVSGIVVVGNRIGRNNLAGDPDTGVTSTTGVMLLSVAVRTSIVVAGNKIFDNVNGIAFNSNVTVVGHNRFANVTHRHLRYTPPAA
jgi:nitrous oxidase accessory protein NosD